MPVSPAAFEKEALVHMDALFRYARRLTEQERDAEDLLQETYLRAVRFFDKYQEGTNCKAWLFRIMHNLHANRWQARSKQQVDSLDDTEEWYLYDKLHDPELQMGDNPEKAFFDHQWTEEVKAAIDVLPQEFRAPLLLCDVEGFSYQEIADILETPVGTVRSRLSRARRRLQKLLWDYVKKERPDLAAGLGSDLPEQDIVR